MKKKLFALGLGITFAFASAVGISKPIQMKQAKAASSITINNLDDFKTVFNRAGNYTNYDIELNADIDVSTYLGNVNSGGACGMAGDYTGTFNGNGHRIYGAVTTGGSDHGILFNLVSGTVKNLVLDWTHQDGNSNGGLCYGPNGTFENVTVVTRANGGNTFAAFGRNSSNGTFINCNAHFIVGAANTFQFIASIVNNPTVTNCYYSGADIVNNGATKVTLNNVSDNMELAVTETAVLDGLYGLPMTWTSSDSTVADVTGNVVSAVGAGTTTLTGTLVAPYNTDFGPYTKTITLDVVSSISPMTEINLNHTSATLKEGASLSLTATPNSSGYDPDSISWSVSDNTYLAVSGNGLTVTVNALAASAVTQTVTISITNTDDNIITASCAIEINESAKMSVYFAVKKDFVNLGTDGYALWFYGGGASEQAFALVDTGYDYNANNVNCDLYLANINLDAANAMNGDNIKDGVFIQLAGGINTGARWGTGYNVTSLAGYVLTMNNWSAGNSSVNNLGNANDMNVVLDFCVDYMKADTISLDNHGTTADCQANYNAAILEIANFSNNQRKLFAGTDYYERLQSWAAANGSSFVIGSDGAIASSRATLNIISKNTNVVLIVVAATSVVVLISLGFVFYSKKRKVQ